MRVNRFIGFTAFYKNRLYLLTHLFQLDYTFFRSFVKTLTNCHEKPVQRDSISVGSGVFRNQTHNIISLGLNFTNYSTKTS